jgi:hypothetical protein
MQMLTRTENDDNKSARLREQADTLRTDKYIPPFWERRTDTWVDEREDLRLWGIDDIRSFVEKEGLKW